MFSEIGKGPTGIWGLEEMWDEKEKLLYGNTPMFMIRAEKPLD